MKPLSLLLALVTFAVGLAVGVYSLRDEDDAVNVDAERRIAGLESRLATLRSEYEDARAALGRKDRELAALRSEIEGLKAQRDAAAQRALGVEAAPSETELEAALEAAKKKQDARERLKNGLAEMKKDPYKVLLDPAGLNKVTEDLKTLGDEGLAQVLGLLASDAKEDRILAAQLLMGLGDPEAIDDLAEVVINDADPEVAAWASQALMRSDGPNAIAELSRAVENSPHEGARVNSMFGLCRLGDEAGVNKTLAYLKDENTSEQMRQALGSGMLILGNPEVMPVIDWVVERKGGESDQVLGAAIDYYGRVKGERARQRLVAISQRSSLSPELARKVQVLLDTF